MINDMRVSLSESVPQSTEPQPSSRQIGSKTEPPSLATEINASRGVSQAKNPQSRVRSREGTIANTPWNRDEFPGCDRVLGEALRIPRPNGGAGSLGGTGLWGEVPDPWGRYREIHHFRTQEWRKPLRSSRSSLSRQPFPCVREQGNSRRTGRIGELAALLKRRARSPAPSNEILGYRCVAQRSGSTSVGGADTRRRRWCMERGPGGGTASRLATNVVDGPHSWDEIQMLRR
jgi:hypothetical protein